MSAATSGPARPWFMYDRAAMRMVWASLFLLTACTFQRDAEPTFTHIEIVDRASGETVPYGTEIRLRVTGEELWGRDVEIDVHAVGPAGSDEIVAALSTTFGTGEEEQVGETEWIVGGDFLAVTGRYRIYFVARFDDVSITSDSLFVEVDPRLESVELDRASGTQVRAGDTITVEITGRDVWGLPLTVELRRTAEDGAESSISEVRTTFDETERTQSALVSFQVDGDVLAVPGRSDLFALARFGEQSATSGSVYVEVETRVETISLFRDTESGRIPMDEAGARPGETLVGRIEGTGLVGETVDVDFFLSGSPDQLIDSVSVTGDGSMLEVTFEMPVEILGGAVTGILFLQVTAGGRSTRSSTFTLHRWGIDHCAWRVDGVERAHDFEVDAGKVVELFVVTWGLEGRSATFEIYENDDIQDDYTDTISDVVSGETLAPIWTTFFMDDGLFNNRNEYYFEVTVEDVSCMSPLLRVNK